MQPVYIVQAERKYESGGSSHSLWRAQARSTNLMLRCDKPHDSLIFIEGGDESQVHESKLSQTTTGNNFVLEGFSRPALWSCCSTQARRRTSLSDFLAADQRVKTVSRHAKDSIVVEPQTRDQTTDKILQIFVSADISKRSTNIVHGDIFSSLMALTLLTRIPRLIDSQHSSAPIRCPSLVTTIYQTHSISAVWTINEYMDT